ncbi:YihY/virulence factor BrkB family protein, partial [Vibrio parahaemolyticus]|nr:YihY/virulence factor BrkB family protein [Vibrio parahaemolyticus]
GALVLTAAVGAVLTLAGSSAITGVASIGAQIVGWLAVAALITFGLTALYRYGPDRDEPKWRWASWGAGLAVVSAVIVSIGFSLYVANFASYNETYG